MNDSSDSIRRDAVPYLSLLIAAVNALIFFVVRHDCALDYGCLDRWGGEFNGAGAAGEWWRLLTVAWLHWDFGHLILNCLALIYFGRAVEAAYGARRFLAIYFGGLVASSLAVLALAAPATMTAGASGAIFAVIGAHVPLNTRLDRWGVLMNRRAGVVQASTVALLFFSSMGEGVSVTGHLGGLVAGMALGAWFRRVSEIRDRATRRERNDSAKACVIRREAHTLPVPVIAGLVVAGAVLLGFNRTAQLGRISGAGDLYVVDDTDIERARVLGFARDLREAIIEAPPPDVILLRREGEGYALGVLGSVNHSVDPDLVRREMALNVMVIAQQALGDTELAFAMLDFDLRETERFDPSLMAAVREPARNLRRAKDLLVEGDADGALDALAAASQGPQYFLSPRTQRLAILEQQGRIADAVAVADEIRSLFSDNAQVLAQTGSAYVRLGTPERALSMLDQALATHPDEPALINARGVALESLQRYAEAERDYRDLLRLQPEAAVAHRNLGDVLEATRRYDEAVLAYTRALELAGDQSWLRVLRAWAMIGAGRCPEARADLELVHQREPGNTKIFAPLANALLCVGDFAGVIARLAPFADRPDEDIHRYLGDAYFLAGDLSGALGEYARVRTLAPANAYASMIHYIVARRLAGPEGAAFAGAGLGPIGDPDRDLADYIAPLPPDRWPVPIARMLLGQLSPEDLLAVAAARPQPERVDWRCEALYHIGERAWLAGDRAAALDAFDGAVATGATAMMEYDLARWRARQVRAAGSAGEARPL
ncbi:rhomboid family intramembrane serine protease [uncultured Lamprocystis sp.]|jgi:membrane associated rhomboid family serine protease/tetratricopeptide (TPR) repeat protein|uniref:rhomboid family intramembrane serine protease n=1 Tax=uncultured Lamprocystis sp. TaxID=543132 RepID=UPI0025CCA60F|nr:rhomboid family intramembrane serine protease [uncultured Lamprocystis sp.]